MTSDTDGVRLWIMDGSGREETSVSVRGVAVRVTYLSPDDSLVSELATSALPLTRVSWFLEQRW